MFKNLIKRFFVSITRLIAYILFIFIGATLVMGFPLFLLVILFALAHLFVDLDEKS